MECTWNEYDPLKKRLYFAKQDLDALIPSGNSFILVDDSKWYSGVVDGWHMIPFLERDGRYWGHPSDDETAIQELERLRRSGANFIVFAWLAF
jgi:hypothetical protein